MIHLAPGHVIGDEPIIAYQNRAHLNALDSGTAGKAGWPLSDATNGLTYGGWQALTAGLSEAEAIYDFGAPVAVDYIGIAAHTLHTAGCSVELFLSTDGVTWGTELIEIVPADDSPILGLFDSATYRYARVLVTYPGADPDPGPILGVITLGARLTVVQRIYGGHSPINLSRATAVRPVLSETGHFLGREIKRKGYRAAYTFRHLKADWYRSEFDPFVEHARSGAFFIAWRPDTFPESVAYGWTTDDIAPTNMGIRDLMEVSFTVEGLGAEVVT